MVYLKDEEEYQFHSNRYCNALEMRAAYIKLQVVGTEAGVSVGYFFI